MTTSAPQIKGGKLRPLAVSTQERSPFMPEVPTLRELGVADFEVTTWYALWAVKGTPKEVIAKLNSTVNSVLAEREFVEKNMTSQGMMPMALSPEQFAELIRKETARMRDIVKQSGAKVTGFYAVEPLCERSVELLLGEDSEAAVRADWDRLAEAGLPSSGRHRSASNRPHITLVAAPSLAPATVPGIDERVAAAAGFVDLPLASAGVLLFGPGRGGYVVVRQVVTTPELLELHRRVCDAVGPVPRQARHFGDAVALQDGVERQVALLRTGAGPQAAPALPNGQNDVHAAQPPKLDQQGESGWSRGQADRG